VISARTGSPAAAAMFAAAAGCAPVMDFLILCPRCGQLSGGVALIPLISAQ